LALALGEQVGGLHGGTLEASSAGEGKGTSFRVRLPVQAVAPPPPEPPAVAAPVQERAEHRDGELPSLAEVSILVVDDDADARELVDRVLSARGATVTVASSGQQALDAVDRAHFDVLVSDIGMPGMDGYALIRKLRSDKQRGPSDLPAIALTAFARSEDR